MVGKGAEGEPLPPVRVVFYMSDDGTVPIAEWTEGLPKKPRAKCFEWMKRLITFGRGLHTPYAENLRDGIYELRVRYQSINYRMLYFFHGNTAVVLTHGFTIEREVPDKEIEKALKLRKKFEADPKTHTFYWEP